MTSDPGDLILDPTCGSGTTAYCAEKWGRRWITTDTSRVPIALARQLLLTGTFEFYQLKEPDRGPAGGFEYQRRQNSKGEEVGGIVPHVTLESIANDEPAKEEVLVDRPETEGGVTRVSGPICVEATIPTPVDWEGDGEEDSGDTAAAETHADHIERMIEVLRHSPVVRLGGGRTVELVKIRRPARTMSLSAEARIEGSREESVAIVFGSENGAVSQTLVFEAAREAYAKGYGHLYVIGFAIQPDARRLVDDCEQAVGVPGTYVQASMDLVMGDLLRNLRSSQIFSVCGLPDVRIRRSEDHDYQVELLGLDVFDPIAMDSDHREGNDVPAWFLDTEFRLPGHVVLAGPNNTGKTTVVQAIASWALALQRWRRLNYFNAGRGYKRAPIARQTFAAVPLRSFDLLWKDRRYQKKRPIEIEIEIQHDASWSVTMEFIADSTEQIYVRPKKDTPPETLRKTDLSAVFVPPMTGLGTDEPLLQPPKIEQLLGLGRPGEILRNLLAEASRDERAWNALQTSIKKLFGYELLPPDASGAHINAEYKMTEDGPLLDIGSAGSGFQQVLMLLAFLNTREGAVLLLEVGAGAAKPHVEDMLAFWRDEFPPAVMKDPLADHRFLNVTKARTELLGPLLEAAGLHGLPYTRYHKIAALMLPEEIHPEVVEKLDAICRAFGVEP